MRRKVISFVLSLTLLAGLALTAGAAEAGKFLRGSYEMAEEQLLLFGKPLPAGGTLTVSSDSVTLDAAAATVGEVKTPVTVYCLVDATTSLNEAQQKQQQDVLANIASRLGEEDNMVIATFDEKLVEGSLTGDSQVINTTAQTIGRSIWTKNLYQSVIQAVNALETGTQYHTDRLLLILSDGNDCGKTDVTEEKAIAAIEKTNLPVYCVALTGNYMNSELTNSVKHLKRLAEASMGGQCYVPAEEQISAANAADKIWQNVQAGSLIWVGLKNLPSLDRDFVLRVQYETDTAKLEDTITIYAADLPQRLPAETLESVSQEPAQPDAQAPTIPLWGWISIGAGLVILVVIILLVVKKKKTQPDDTNTSTDTGSDTDSSKPIVDTPVIDDVGSTTSVGTWEWNTNNQATQPVGSPVNGCRLEFVALMHPDVHFEYQLPAHAPTTFGRDSRADLILNGNDAKLSGIHFEAEWDEKHLYLRDKGSTNGTRINGGVCKPESWIQVEDGSLLSAGGYEYRVSVSSLKA